MGTPIRDINWLLMLCGVIAAMIGAWLLKRGRWPRRTGDTPHCPGCDYILTGLDASRCPECGSEIAPTRIVRGERHPRRGLATLGALILLLGLFITGVGVTGVASRIEWYRHKPFGWVLKDMKSPQSGLPAKALLELMRRNSANQLSPDQRKRWIDAMLADLASPAYQITIQQIKWVELEQFATAGSLTTAQLAKWIDQMFKDLDASQLRSNIQAWNEIQRLLATKSLSAAQLVKLLERALQEQKQPGRNLTLTICFIDFLGQSYLDGSLSPDLQKRFLDNISATELKVRPRVASGDPIPYRLEMSGHGPSDWRMKIEYVGVWVNGKQIQGGGGSMSGSIGGGSFGSTVEPQPAGRHHLRVVMKMIIGKDDAGTEKPVRTEEREFSADFDVTAGGTAIKLLDSPDAGALAAAIFPAQFEVRPGDYEPLRGQIELRNPPVDVAFEAFARINGKEYRLGTIALPAKKQTSFVVGCRTLPAEPIREFDLVLRSSEKAAKGTIDLTQIWKGEIVIPRVKVKQAATRPGK